MKKYIFAFLFITLLGNSNAYAQWYVGGTLHKVKLSEWSKATEKNKLATAADWAMVSVPDPKPHPNSEAIKARALDIVTCLREVENTPAAQNEAAATIAAFCITMLYN